ncbi:hypothetical protein GmHk_U059412 [Glycine max]|nr:hypothetical protein GmHk_U059412 [Glycine max]
MSSDFPSLDDKGADDDITIRYLRMSSDSPSMDDQGADDDNLTKPTSEPRSGFYSERFDIYIACFRKLAPTDAEKREELEPEKRHANRGMILAFQSQSRKIQKLSLSLTQPSSSLLPPPLLPNKAPTFGHQFCSKSRKEGIFGVVKCVSTSGTSKFQIVMAAQLIRDRVEMKCLEGAWETLEGNTRCRFQGTI